MSLFTLVLPTMHCRREIKHRIEQARARERQASERIALAEVAIRREVPHRPLADQARQMLEDYAKQSLQGETGRLIDEEIRKAAEAEIKEIRFSHETALKRLDVASSAAIEGERKKHGGDLAEFERQERVINAAAVRVRERLEIRHEEQIARMKAEFKLVGDQARERVISRLLAEADRNGTTAEMMARMSRETGAS